MKIDLLYVGNISLDKIKCFDGNVKEVWGGSALYSALASRIVYKGSIGIYSVVGMDFNWIILSENKITFLGKRSNNRKSNKFIIDEKDGNCFLKNKRYLPFTTVSQTIHVKHLHISFRKGVPIEKILLSNLKFDHLSVDVMRYSVSETKKLLLKYLNIINVIFCNQLEYNIIKDILNNNVEVFVTDEGRPVKHYINKHEQNYHVFGIMNKYIKSTTGAGDTFIGGFLGCYLKTGNRKEAIHTAIKLSGLSLLNYGNLDLIRNIGKKVN